MIEKVIEGIEFDYMPLRALAGAEKEKGHVLLANQFGKSKGGLYLPINKVVVKGLNPGRYESKRHEDKLSQESKEENAREDRRNEVNILKDLNHPRIPRVVEHLHGKDERESINGEEYAVFTYFNGINLYQ